MAKTVFRPGEIALIDSKVVLEPPFPEEKPEEAEPDAPEDIESDDIFVGPTPAELQAESEKRKAEWETEKTVLFNAAKSEAEIIVEDAKRSAQTKIDEATDKAASIVEEAHKNAEQISADAVGRVTVLEENTAVKLEEERKTARNEGFEKGREEGYNSGLAEVQRLVVRTQVILERLQDKRADILAEAEQQIIDLALLIARKVVKTIADTQRTIVVENIKEALLKIKSRGNITIKVNLADLQLSTAHLADFTRMVEGAGSIQILEDSSIDPGGCVIETDFGEIDARIANQFAELEAKILALSPIKSTAN